MEARREALRRSAYYQQVASDIPWSQEEHRRIEAQVELLHPLSYAGKEMERYG